MKDNPNGLDADSESEAESSPPPACYLTNLPDRKEKRMTDNQAVQLRKQAIELMIPIISEVRRGNLSVYEAIKRLRDLRYPCQNPNCIAGRAVITTLLTTGYGTCPECKGTGKSDVLVVALLDFDQTLPKVTMDIHLWRDYSPDMAYDKAQQDMQDAGFRKVLK